MIMAETPREITVDDLASAGLPPGRLVDVRSEQEYVEGHVPGAVNVALEDVLADPGRFGDQEVSVICQSGGRSLQAAEAIAASGTPAVSVTGGTSAWTESGRDVERGQ